jgi:phage FluMu protein Com
MEVISNAVCKLQKIDKKCPECKTLALMLSTDTGCLAEIAVYLHVQFLASYMNAK